MQLLLRAVFKAGSHLGQDDNWAKDIWAKDIWARMDIWARDIWAHGHLGQNDIWAIDIWARGHLGQNEAMLLIRGVLHFGPNVNGPKCPWPKCHSGPNVHEPKCLWPICPFWPKCPWPKWLAQLSFWPKWDPAKNILTCRLPIGFEPSNGLADYQVVDCFYFRLRSAVKNFFLCCLNFALSVWAWKIYLK